MVSQKYNKKAAIIATSCLPGQQLLAILVNSFFVLPSYYDSVIIFMSTLNVKEDIFMAKEKSDSKLSKKQEAITSDLLSDKIFGTKKMQKKNKQADDYIYHLAKTFFETCNNKEIIPTEFSNLVAYKLDSNLITDAEFERKVKASPAGNSAKKSITTSHLVNLEQLKKLNICEDALEGLDTSSKSAAFSLEILKYENEYFLAICKN